MKRIIGLLGCWLIILAFSGTAFSKTTVLEDVWKDKAYAGKLKKITVFWIDQDRARRVIIEDEFMRQLKARGIEAFPMYIVIRPDKMVEKEAALDKIKALGAAAILTVRMIDKRTAQSEIPDPARQDAAEASAPSFYHYVYDTVIRESDESAYLETILFDSATEKRVWAARSISKIKPGNQETMKAIVETLIDRLAADKMIK